MRSDRNKEARRRQWRDVKEIGRFVAGLLLLLLVVVGGVMLPGLLTDSASTVGLRAVKAAQR